MNLKATFGRLFMGKEKDIQVPSFSAEQLKNLHAGKSVIFEVNGKDFELCKVPVYEKDEEGHSLSETFLFSDEARRTIGRFTFDCSNYCWYENYDFQQKWGDVYRQVFKQLNAQKEDGKQAFLSSDVTKATNQSLLKNLENDN